MKRKMILVAEVAKRWLKSPSMRDAYDALEEEFAIAGAFIAARSRAKPPNSKLPSAWAPRRRWSRVLKADG